MSQVLLNTLTAHHDVSILTEDSFADFVNGHPDRVSMVFFTGDPAKKLETADVAVVVRELLTQHPGKVQLGIVAPDHERVLMKTCAVSALPSLVFFVEGRQRAVLPKIQDWSVYAEKLDELFTHLPEGEAA